MYTLSYLYIAAILFGCIILPTKRLCNCEQQIDAYDRAIVLGHKETIRFANPDIYIFK